ncbi:hypothetical protein CWATWH0401_3090 [Crocosphaera watsonii WH 0401]|uniref:Uncharacterized protein n=2 Tax=Crocosphaera watsonii TaxID=263511 RepID=G5JAW8_CROWT|nr:hypothetical protein CWATWH0003_4579 [Crocosphaera watsonii WH 0003]CCQ59802.1 hypothetical protein CWATWH0401_3090 [Crocosphaera watsonii WH 0401]
MRIKTYDVLIKIKATPNPPYDLIKDISYDPLTTPLKKGGIIGKAGMISREWLN